MLRSFVVLCCFLAINCQQLEEHPAPEPYSFAFSSPNDDGTSSSREETGDASGRVTGSYTILGADGQQRRVEYVADENGFRANVITNEIGTESKNAADVSISSSAPTAEVLSHQWEASNAGKLKTLVQQPYGSASYGTKVAPVAPVISQVRQLAVPLAPVLKSQTLKLNQGIRIAPVAPIARAPLLPVPIAQTASVEPVAPVVRSNVVLKPAPIAAPLPTPQLLGVRSGGIISSRAQTLIPNSGILSTGITPLNLGLPAINTIGLNQFGIRAVPLNINSGIVQQVEEVKPALNSVPVQGSNVLLFRDSGLLRPLVSGLSNQPLEQVTLTQVKESDSEEDYRKSK